jgi:lipoprotein-anchoring transpeptidase ErfK/SrfK
MRKLLIHIGMLVAGTLLLGSATLGTAKAFETGIAVDAAARAKAEADLLPPATAAAPAPPAALPPVPAAGLSVDPASLEPGEFVWQPDLASGGEVEIVVSVPLQRAFVYRGGTLIGVSTVSTGRRGHATPTGRFAIMEKHREHFSNLYNDAPMPFMQRLTMGGIALHAGAIPGRPASHGCVRLPLAFAGHLFGATKVGATVHVTDGAPAAAEALAGSNIVYAAISGPLVDARRAAN